jgi:hypothetical protein
MNQITFTKPCATLEEVHQFANAVREAGGGNPIDALMPAVPVSGQECLIAKNLNFNCSVFQIEHLLSARWAMILDDKDTRDRIATSLDLASVDIDNTIQENGFYGDNIPYFDHKYHPESCWAIILPAEIGAVAHEFDEWRSAIIWTSTDAKLSDTDFEGRERLRRFWPYVEASVKEAYANASFVNEEGELVL